MTGDNTLYCGASGYSIQEVDLSKFTSTTFYSGTRKMLGKQSIYSLNIQDGLLFAGGSTVAGTVGKVRNYNCSDFLQHMLWKITYLGEQLPHMAGILSHEQGCNMILPNWIRHSADFSQRRLHIHGHEKWDH